jgi:hypothetical protein
MVSFTVFTVRPQLTLSPFTFICARPYWWILTGLRLDYSSQCQPVKDTTLRCDSVVSSNMHMGAS